MAKIRWTSEAQAWLKDIHDYIAEDNPSVAAGVVQGIYEKVQTLRQFPDTGYVYRFEGEGEIRILLYGHYRIAYSDVIGVGPSHSKAVLNFEC